MKAAIAKAEFPTTTTQLQQLHWEQSDIKHDTTLPPQTVRFDGRVVKQAYACISGFKLEHEDGDHHTKGQQVSLSTSVLSRNEVSVTPTVGMWDKHADRKFDVDLDAVIIAVCEME